MELKNLNFSETLEYIAKGRFEGVNIPVQKTSLHIRFTTQEWTKDNLFFLDPNILKRENIFLVKDYWWGRSGNWKKNKWGTELCIAYYFPETEHTKLYFPNNPPEQKWFANINSNDIFGLDSLNQEGDRFFNPIGIYFIPIYCKFTCCRIKLTKFKVYIHQV